MFLDGILVILNDYAGALSRYLRISFHIAGQTSRWIKIPIPCTVKAAGKAADGAGHWLPPQ
jgi:hypothetical protein